MLTSTNSPPSKEIVKLINDYGLSIIPAKIVNGDKKPCIDWVDVKKVLNPNEVFDFLDRFQTEYVCIKCGSFSENLICLDIDTKNKVGFDAIFFNDIKDSAYSDLFSSMRIEKTPSGGYHFYFKIDLPITEICPSSSKVASRAATKEEIASGKSKEKWKCFLEIKGNGGLSHCYPGPGYQLIREGKKKNSFGEEEVGIPILSFEDYHSILTFCSNYDERVVEEGVKGKGGSNSGAAKEQIDRYIQGKNPYQCFDVSEEGSSILLEAGWNLVRKFPKYHTYRKPNKKANETDAMFHLEKRYYRIFSTNAEFEDGAYSPSDLLARIKYNEVGKKPQTYEHLVSRGFGVYKESFEKNYVKRLAKSGVVTSSIDLPANISQSARIEFDAQLEKLKSTYPHGLFWEIKDSGEVSISQKGIDCVIQSMGFKFYGGKIYLVSGNGYVLKTISEGELFHHLLLYVGGVSGAKEGVEVDGIDSDTRTIYDAYSRYINTFHKLTISRLKEFGKIEEERLLISSKRVSFKFYLNCYIKITKDEILSIDYKEIGDKLIFEDTILKRKYDADFHTTLKDFDIMKSKPWIFLDKSIGVTKNLFEILGYLTHDFIDDSMNAIIVASEACDDPKKGGGAGKNLLFNLLNHVTSVHVIGGRQVELDKNLLQSFNGERILVISDVDKKFDYSFFKDFSSGAASLKKLYQDVVVMSRNKMPKPVILTNYSYDVTSGLERRIIPLEFTEFFSKIRGGVGKFFSCMFPGFESVGDWTLEDWYAFDSIIFESIKGFLFAGELVPAELSKGGWVKQFKQNYTDMTFLFIEENIIDFLASEKGRVETKYFNDLYTKFCHANNINQKYQASAFLMNKALDEYCEHHSIDFNKSAAWKENNVTTKGRTFYKINLVRVELSEIEHIGSGGEEFSALDSENFNLEEEELPF